MSMELNDDAHHEVLERRRSLVMQRLTRVLDALDRKRHAVTDAVTDVVDPPPAVARQRERTAVAVVGAVAGVAAVAVMLWVNHRRHQRSRPLSLLGRALGHYVRPPEPSLGRQLVMKAVTSLALPILAEVAKRRVDKMMAVSPETPDDIPIVDTPPAPEVVVVEVEPTPQVPISVVPPAPVAYPMTPKI